MNTDFSNLSRPRYPMPDFVARALEERGLLDAYQQRPAYQQNDYIGWITRAKRPETKAKRLNQMLDELEKGGVYMGMKHAGSQKTQEFRLAEKAGVAIMPVREELLSALNDTVSDFLMVYRGMADSGWMVYEGWTAKDVLGHITFWHESFARNVADLSRGVKPTPLKGRLMDLNQQSVDDMRPLTMEDVTARFNAAHSVIQANILNPQIGLIPYKKGARDYTPEEHLDIVNGHIQKHLKDVKAAR